MMCTSDPSTYGAPCYSKAGGGGVTKNLEGNTKETWTLYVLPLSLSLCVLIII